MILSVWLGAVRVGTLRSRPGGSGAEFELSAEYREQAQRPVLGQQFEDEPDRVWKTTHRVPAWFSNLLPEGQLRRLLATRAGVHEEHELQLLGALGQDLPGNVVVQVESGGGELETPPPARAAVDPDDALRFSLAGLQLKIGVVERDKGVTVPVRGQGSRFILKLPDGRFDRVPENEHAMLSWARAAGIEVPDHRLVDLRQVDDLPDELRGGEVGLLVRRFDRVEGGAGVHGEDFAQVLGLFAHDKYGKANYETLGRNVVAICGEDALREFVRRLVFMVLSGNADMHVKNWGLQYVGPHGRDARLAPAYDLVPTLVYERTSRKLALKLGGTLSFQEIGVDTFRRWARKVERSPESVEAWVIEDVDRIDAGWPVAREQLSLEHARRLAAHRTSVPLGRSRYHISHSSSAS